MDSKDNKLNVEDIYTRLQKAEDAVKSIKKEMQMYKKVEKSNECIMQCASMTGICRQIIKEKVRVGGGTHLDWTVTVPFDIKRILYPLEVNEDIRDFQLGRTDYTKCNYNFMITGVKPPSNNAEDKVYSYVCEYFNNVFPIKVTLKPEDWGYSDEAFIAKDTSIIFQKNEAFIPVYFHMP